MIISMADQKFSFGVDTFGGRIAWFRTLDGVEILQSLPGSDARALTPDDCGGFALFPLCNRVRGNAFVCQGQQIRLPLCSPDHTEYNHGPGWCSDFVLHSQSEHEICLRFDFKDPACPYQYSFLQHFVLSASGLKICLEGINQGRSVLPFGIGFHPYFKLYPDTVVSFAATGIYPAGEGNFTGPWSAHVPPEFDFTAGRAVPELFINHCYSGVNRVKLQHGQRLQVELCSSLPYLMLYHLPGRDFAALEPQSQPVDAVHLDGLPGLTALTPGAALRAELELKVS